MYLLLLFFHIFVILIIFMIINNFSKKIIINLIFGSLLFSTLISIFLVYEVVYLNSFCYIELGSWFTVGSLKLKKPLKLLIYQNKKSNLNLIKQLYPMNIVQYNKKNLNKQLHKPKK